MPTYVFESSDGVQIEREFTVSECPQVVRLRDVEYRKIIAPCSFYVPPWMRAPGAKGSSSDSSEKQAAYLKSDAHRANMQQAERIAERSGKAEERGRQAIQERLGG